MATSLSLDEQRTICKLYESGKSFKEIREITGRSREADKKIADCASADIHLQQLYCTYAYDIPNMIKEIQNGKAN